MALLEENFRFFVFVFVFVFAFVLALALVVVDPGQESLDDEIEPQGRCAKTHSGSGSIELRPLRPRVRTTARNHLDRSSGQQRAGRAGTGATSPVRHGID